VVGSFAVGGVQQGLNNYNPDAALVALRVSTTGWIFFLLGSLLFAANIFVMTFKWKIGIAKTVIAFIKSPLKTAEVKS
jgi:hypothetical protein